ncbi:MAG: glutamate racemase [Bdellovibrionales bacterium]|nr:glutamate racemase [Bdellovibrionales bacterium]
MKKTIGVIDSGIGGLTFVQEIQKQKLNVNLLYVCDSRNVPYGGKSQGFMKERIEIMMQNLLGKKIDAVLMACNTLTAETIDGLRSRFHLPIVGIEPYMRHAKLTTSQAKYALILTPATFSSKRFQKLQMENDPASKIDVFPLTKLAMLIESLKNNPFDAIREEVSKELLILKDKGYTHLILGCTHYTIISRWIESYLNVEVVDPTRNVIEHMKMMLSLGSSTPDESFLYSEDCGERWDSKAMKDFAFMDFAV